MINKRDRKKLQKLLDLAVDRADVFTLDELEGFLYGLAVTPDPIMPSEWMPVVFGEDMIEADSEKEAQELFNVLLHTTNNFIARFHKDTLRFPFEPEDFNSSQGLVTIRAWTFGFQEALFLRPEIWHPEKGGIGLAEEQDDLESSLAVLHGIVEPDQIGEIFEGDHDADQDEKMRVLAKLYALLPHAVDTIQHYGFVLEQERHRKSDTLHDPIPDKRTSLKVGRNEPCPCGSGRKYKKCCLHGNIVPLFPDRDK